jgi:3-(3-hydroxy-phenyl)propionate hydroxylase
MMTATPDCDVLIIGGGPTGVTLGLLLAQNGVSTTIVEKEAAIYPLPRAAHIDHETVRIFQQLGVAETIMEASRSARRYDFLSADGQILLRFEGTDRIGPGGWPLANMIHQPSVEGALNDRIAQQPMITLHRTWAFTTFEEDADGVTATVTTPQGERRLKARYLVGADGARSPVREAAGIAFDDLKFDEPWLVIDAIVHDPSRLPDVNLQICNPERPTTCVLMGEGRHRWEFMIKPSETPADVLNDTFIEQLLEPWNVKGAVSLERKAVYRFNAKIAKRWRKGRVLLAGDAAHQMPPFAGQGLCSGLRDAANLSWKLAAVIGGANEAVLDTYQPEREPHVGAIIDMAIMMGRTVCITDPLAAAERDKHMLAARAAGASSDGAISYPPISEGLVLPGNAGAGGYFPQSLAGGQRLDDVLGPGAWLISRDPAGAVSDLHAASLNDAALAPFAEDLAAWLAAHNAEAVLVRPDRYVFGTGAAAHLVDAWARART